MPKKTAAQLDAEIEAELEATAADYVGVAQAKQMAKAGHFQDQRKRQKETPAPQQKDPVHYELRTIGGAVHARTRTPEAAIAKADEDSRYVYILWRCDGSEHKRIADNYKAKAGGRAWTYRSEVPI